MASTIKINPLNTKFDPLKSEFLAVAIKYNGNIKEIANHYNIALSTAYDYINRSEDGREVIAQVRGINTETDLDLAEKVYRYNMANIKERPALAQRAAEKVIEGKGHLRGWKTPITEEVRQPVTIEASLDGIACGSDLQAKTLPTQPNQSPE